MLAVPLPFPNEMVALFLVSVGTTYLCYRLRLVPIAGILITGVLNGGEAVRQAEGGGVGRRVHVEPRC